MSDRIYSLATIHETRLRPGGRVFAGPNAMAEFLVDLARRGMRPGYALPSRGSESDEEPVNATVSAVEVAPGEFVARWIAECQQPLYRGRERGDEPCGRALTVEPEDPRFYCPPSCAFAGAVAGGHWRRVMFPELRVEIEQVLLHRHPADRHTVAGDTLETISAENLEHGDPVSFTVGGPVAVDSSDASLLEERRL